MTEKKARKQIRRQKELENRKKIRKRTAVGLITTFTGMGVVASSTVPTKVNAIETKEAKSTEKAVTNKKITDEQKTSFIEKINKSLEKDLEDIKEDTELTRSELLAYAIQRSNWGTESYVTTPQNNMYALPMEQDRQNFSFEDAIQKNQNLATYKNQKENTEDFIRLMKQTPVDDNSSLAKEIEKIIADNELTTYDEENIQIYVVQSGDSISSIAWDFGIEPQQIIDDNNLSEYGLIYIGQELTIKNGSKSIAPEIVAEPVESKVAIEPETQSEIQPETIVTDETNTPENIVEPEKEPEVTPEVTPTPVEPEKEPEVTPEVTPTPVEPEKEPEVTPEVTPTPVEPEKEPEVTPEVTPTPVEPEKEPEVTPEVTPTPVEPEKEPEVTPEVTPTPVEPEKEPEVTPEVTPTPVNPNTTNAQAVINEAQKHLGVPYLWAGKTPNGFDCSGFTQYVFQTAVGINIGGWTVPQESAGVQIPVEQAQAGDLYFWGSPGSTYHVAISLGGGQFIHAPQPGDVVSYGSIQYFAPSFAVRVL
ncbi:C40 family peptidase [Enterococcus sp. LJL99]